MHSLPPASVLCLGAAHWDCIGRAWRPVGPGADEPGLVLRRPGGVALNIALALARRNVAVALRAAIGSDAEGTALIAEAGVAGIDCARVLRLPGPTDRYLAIEEPDGTLVAAVADCGGLETSALALVADLDWIGPDGCILADGNLPLPALEKLAEGSAPLILVPASPAKAAALAPLVPTGRFALYVNRPEAEALAGQAFPDAVTAARALVAAGAPQAVVTDGAAAACHAGPDGALTAMPPPRPAASLTGAGDALVAAHLAARLAGADPETALAAGLAAAARHNVPETR